MSRVIRVVIVDDHPMIVDGLALALDVPGISVVGTAAKVGEALAIAASEPDVMILDVHLPDGSGVEAITRIKQHHPAVAILVLTMSAEHHVVTSALSAGATGYLLKGASRDEIVRGVRAVADGQIILAANVAAAALGPSPHTSRFSHLTDREQQVLALLGDGLGNPAIAARLGMSAKTVANHVSAILAKLQVADRVQAALLFRAQDSGGGSGI